MKSRQSYFMVSGIIILSIYIGIFIWHYQNHQEASNFKEKSFTAPISSKYIPTNADLVLHWKVNPTILPEYIENYQDRVKKNIVNKKVKLIRDSAFRLISLDFTKEISSFSGGYGSFGIFESNKQLLDDWLMVLEINKDVNIDIKKEPIQKKIILKDHDTSKEKKERKLKKIDISTIVDKINKTKKKQDSSNVKTSISQLTKKSSKKLTLIAS